MWMDKSFRLLLNTKLFEKMQIDRINKKSLRFNAFDTGTIRLFLVKVSAFILACVVPDFLHLL
jgi:hypothetical protein